LSDSNPNKILKGEYRAEVKKPSGASIPLGLFMNEQMQEISAVIFSNTATWGKIRALSQDPNPNIVFNAIRYNPKSVTPYYIRQAKKDYHETLLDGLQIYHNPWAREPLNPSLFRHRDIVQHYYSENEREWIYEVAEGVLMFRDVQTFITEASS